MLTALRQRNFALLWTGGVISLIGDWMLFVGLPIFVFSLTNSAVATGLTFIIETLPKVLLGSVAGVFVDRWNRKRVMVICDVIRAAAVLSLLLVRSADQVWIVYIVAGVMTTVSQFFNPAESALIPEIVDEEHLTEANSTASVGTNLTRLIGPALAGVLIKSLGFAIVIVIDAASFLLSGTLIALIAVRAARAGSAAETAADAPPADAAGEAGDSYHVPDAPPEKVPGLGSLWRDWIDGLRLVRHNRPVATIFAIISFIAPAEGILQVLFVIFVNKRLNGGAEEFGLLLTAQGVGGLISGLLFSKIGKLLSPRLMIGASAILNGLILVAIYNFASFPVALGLFALAGFPVVALFVSIQTMLQKNVPQEYLGRVFGSFSTTMAITTLIGMGAASLLSDVIGYQIMLNANAALNMLAGLTALLLIPAQSAAPGPVDIEPAQVS